MTHRLAITRLGAGRALVLLHPLGAHRGVWRPVLERLAQEHEVFALDLPGFGESPPLHEGPPTPRRLAEAIAAEMQELGIQRFAAAGNSLGGWVALELGLMRAADQVIAIAPAGLWRSPLRPKQSLGQPIARALYPLIGPMLRIGPLRRAILSTQVAHPARIPYEDVLELVRRFARAPGLRSTNEVMRAGRFTALDQIEVPVTLVWPEFDRLVAPPRQLPPNVVSIGLPATGHLPMWDDPERLANVLLDALRAPAAERRVSERTELRNPGDFISGDVGAE